MEWTKLPENRALLEDRRAANPVVAPSAPDSVVFGVPQTPHEFELLKQKLAQREYYKQHGRPMPTPDLNGILQASAPEQAPGPGDPAGIESRRAAILARIAADQKALAELDRMGAAVAVSKPKKR